MASEEKVHVQNTRRKRKFDSLSAGPKAKFSPSTGSTVNSQAPRGINVVEFAEARALELHNMVEGVQIADRTGKKRLFQSLPKHMRRRAMSYNVKRMPVRLREQAKKEMEKSKLESRPAKKCRRQRRKAKVLVEDYNRRNKENIWLETHIWHAKRMKMVNAWGYRLAEHPSDKSFRAAHRAVANNCLLQDISYYGCIEIKGNKQHILSAMSVLTRTELGPTLSSLDYINTGKEGHAVLYNKDCYPFGAIGPVSFLWRQFSSGSNTPNYNTKSRSVDDNDNVYHKPQLWIWTHPACFSEAFRAITEACKTVASEVIIKEDNTSDNANALLEAAQEENMTSKIMQDDVVAVSSLRFDLARFRLSGPLSHALLTSMLEFPAKNESTQDGVKCLMDSKDDDDDDELLLAKNVKEKTKNETSKYSSDANGMDFQSDNTNVQRAEDFWERIKLANSSSVLPAHTVIALTVIDPRLGMPRIRSSIDTVLPQQQARQGDIPPSLSSSDQRNLLSHCSSTLLCSSFPSHIAASGIWDPEIRQHVKQTKIEEQKLNQMRSKLLVPGSQLNLGDKTSHIPLLLVQQPGSNGYSAGWDIILPSGWSMAFWMALVYRGARVGGLRESRNCSLEGEEPYFPRDVPDTRSGMQHNRDVEREEENKYNRYPPAKRPNYNKLGILSAFFIPWSQLVKEWSLEAQKCKRGLGRRQINTDFSLVRQPIDNVSSLNTQKVDNVSTLGKPKIDMSTTDRRQTIDNPSSSSERQVIDDVTSMDRQVLADNVTPLHRAKIENEKKNETAVDSEGLDVDMAQGFEGDLDDSNRTFYVLRDLSQLNILRKTITLLQRKTRRSKPSSTSDGAVNTQLIVDIISRNPQALVGVSLRMLNKGYPLPNATVSIPSVADLEAFEKDKTFGGPVEPLHKGPKQTISRSLTGVQSTILGGCTRKVIGFVTSGHYSLSRGVGVGIAYCALPGLVELLTTRNQTVVLVRNTKTQQYRLAFLQKLLQHNIK